MHPKVNGSKRKCRRVFKLFQFQWYFFFNLSILFFCFRVLFFLIFLCIPLCPIKCIFASSFETGTIASGVAALPLEWNFLWLMNFQRRLSVHQLFFVPVFFWNHYLFESIVRIIRTNELFFAYKDLESIFFWNHCFLKVLLSLDLSLFEAKVSWIKRARPFSALKRKLWVQRVRSWRREKKGPNLHIISRHNN